MKTNIFFFAALFFAAIVVSSCQKDDETSTVIIDEIADDIASTLGGNGSGLADEFTETTQIADRFNASLKAAVADTLYATDTTFARTIPQGLRINILTISPESMAMFTRLVKAIFIIMEV
jgi:hypothetical protein